MEMGEVQHVKLNQDLFVLENLVCDIIEETVSEKGLKLEMMETLILETAVVQLEQPNQDSHDQMLILTFAKTEEME